MPSLTKLEAVRELCKHAIEAADVPGSEAGALAAVEGAKALVKEAIHRRRNKESRRARGKDCQSLAKGAEVCRASAKSAAACGLCEHFGMAPSCLDGGKEACRLFAGKDGDA